MLRMAGAGRRRGRRGLQASIRSIRGSVALRRSSLSAQSCRAGVYRVWGFFGGSTPKPYDP